MNSTEKSQQEQLEGGHGTGKSAADHPVAIYEVHLPSWMRVPEEGNRPLTYFEIAPKLAEYAQYLNFTHVQLHLPDHHDEHGIKYLIHQLHEHGLRVISGAQEPESQNGNQLFDGVYAKGRAEISGLHFQWDTAWAEDMVAYLGLDPIYRKPYQGHFRMRDSYAFGANYVLPLGHDLVTQPRQSLLMAMSGDEWKKFANLRLLFAYQYLSPGKKLIFMGNEFGQMSPWQPSTSLDWHLMNETNFHGKLRRWILNLNCFYRGERSLHETDCHAEGFQWADTTDAECSVVSFLRRDADARENLLAVFNFTPVPRYNYRVGAPRAGFWQEVLNSDAAEFGGSGQGNLGGVEAAPFGWNFQSHSLMLTLPPLGAVVLKSSS